MTKISQPYLEHALGINENGISNIPNESIEYLVLFKLSSLKMFMSLLDFGTSLMPIII
jgi:hypothetical protein